MSEKPNGKSRFMRITRTDSVFITLLINILLVLSSTQVDSKVTSADEAEKGGQVLFDKKTNVIFYLESNAQITWLFTCHLTPLIH
jgi:hypothetical protein